MDKCTNGLMTLGNAACRLRNVIMTINQQVYGTPNQEPPMIHQPINIHARFSSGLVPIDVYVTYLVDRLIELDNKSQQATQEEIESIEAVRIPLRERLKFCLSIKE
jgi:hypothetical protein